MHPSNQGRLSYKTAAGWLAFGGGGTFALSGGGAAGGGDDQQICGQATQATRVCIDGGRSVITLIRASGQIKIPVTHQAPSQLLPGGTAHYGTGDLSSIQGMAANQQVALILHPDGTGKLVYTTAGGWTPFGGVTTFPMQ